VIFKQLDRMILVGDSVLPALKRGQPAQNTGFIYLLLEVWLSRALPYSTGQYRERAPAVVAIQVGEVELAAFVRGSKARVEI